MSSGADFSVVIPVHGRAELLARLLGSLREAETGASQVEIVVVDSSGDAEALVIREACASLGAAWLAGPKNVRRKRNLGAGATTAPWLLFLDSDCTASPALFGAYEAAIAADAALTQVYAR